MSLRLIFTLLLCCAASLIINAQVVISGVVLDDSKINYVEGARVISTGGQLSSTDSMGRYSIRTGPNDSLFFIYNNKPTQKFAVASIFNTEKFDISLHIPVKGKFKALQEVVVYSKSYRQDSVENREEYKNIFGYKKPGIESSITPGGGVGLDFGEFINIFRFKRNKRLKSFQSFLEEQEQEKYINYRFSKRAVQRITQLKSPALDSFMIWYRPTYLFASSSNELVFNQYILNALYQYRRVVANAEAIKEEEN